MLDDQQELAQQRQQAQEEPEQSSQEATTAKAIANTYRTSSEDQPASDETSNAAQVLGGPADDNPYVSDAQRRLAEIVKYVDNG